MKRVAWWVIPAAAAAIVYLNTLPADFVYDDTVQILQNPWVQDPSYLPRVVSEPVWAFRTTGPTNYYRPVQMGLYNLSWWLSGGRPAAFHAVNVVFHVLNVLVLAFLARRLTGSNAAAFAASLLFAVHPATTESVAWIACLPELTWTFFFLVALGAHFGAGAAGSGARRRALRVVALLAAGMSFLSKEPALTLPAIVFLLEWLGPSPADRKVGGRLVSAARATTPYVLVAIAYLVLRLAVVGGVAPRGRGVLTMADAWINAPGLVVSYLRLVLFPVRLSAHHVFDPLPGFLSPGFLVPTLILIVLAVLTAPLVKRAPDLAIPLAIGILPLLPVLYVPAVGDNAFAERYAYVPIAGLLWAAAAAAVRFGGRHVRAIVVVAAALAIPMGTMTMVRNMVWHDDGSLARATLEVEPRAAHMYAILAGWHARSGDLESARDVYAAALERFPENLNLQTGMITVRLELREIGLRQAVAALGSLAERFPGSYTIAVNLGATLLRAHRYDDAERTYRRAIAMNPTGRQGYDGLRLVLLAQGRSEDAEQVGSLAPGLVDDPLEERLVEGTAHAREGRLGEAEAAFLEALAHDPASDRALLALAVVSSRRGDDRAAIEYCRRAIVANPRSTLAYRQLAASAVRLGDEDGARDALEAALAIDPRDVDTLTRLGAVHARAGRLPAARRAFEGALAVDPDYAPARESLARLDALERVSGPSGDPASPESPRR